MHAIWWSRRSEPRRTRTPPASVARICFSTWHVCSLVCGGGTESRVEAGDPKSLCSEGSKFLSAGAPCVAAWPSSTPFLKSLRSTSKIPFFLAEKRGRFIINTAPQKSETWFSVRTCLLTRCQARARAAEKQQEVCPLSRPHGPLWQTVNTLKQLGASCRWAEF